MARISEYNPTVTYKKVVEENPYMKFVGFADNNYQLSENEYFALMVTDYGYPGNNSPHVKGIDANTHEALVGVEKTSGKEHEGVYISKKYNRRRDSGRGRTIVVEVLPEHLNKFCDLTY